MDDPSVADVLEFESWPEEQRKLAERVLGRPYKPEKYELHNPRRLPPDWLNYESRF